MQQTTETLFGTDGIRGVAGNFPLDARTVRIIGGSLARLLEERVGRAPRFVTGRDTRESGAEIESSFIAGAVNAGATCHSTGVMTTPGVAFLTREFGFDAGIVISASHNPYQDNGIKVFLPNGRKLDDQSERLIEADIFTGRCEHFGKAPAVAPVTDSVSEYRGAYLEHLSAEADASLSRLKIVLDCANGAASALAPELFRSLGVRVITIHDQPDGRNINLDCGSLHLEKLRQRVLDEKADFGAAFDGDADRALFVDEMGEIIDGDATLWVMARHLLNLGGLENRSVVATVMSNIGLELALTSIGVKLLRTAVGDKYVLDELLKTGSELGGEQSGHIIFPRKSLVGDGMLTTLSFLKAVVSEGQTASKAVEGFVRYPQVLLNVPVSEKKPFADVPEISEAAKNVEAELAGTGRLLLRYSGTENLARVMIEGKDQATIDRQAAGIAEAIRRSLGRAY